MKQESFRDSGVMEFSMAIPRDWDAGQDFIVNKNKEFIEDKYELITYFETPAMPNIKLHLCRKNKTAEFVVGFDEETQITNKLGTSSQTRFKIVFMMQLSRENALGAKLGNHRLYNVDGVSTIDETLFRRSGIAFFVYRYLVKELKWYLLGDKDQFYGARRLWAKLSLEVDTVVDIVDIHKKEVVYEDVVLHHGRADADFDERLWSYEGEKENLRPVLKDII